MKKIAMRMIGLFLSLKHYEVIPACPESYLASVTKKNDDSGQAGMTSKAKRDRP
jgi:hypothetical protein